MKCLFAWAAIAVLLAVGAAASKPSSPPLFLDWLEARSAASATPATSASVHAASIASADEEPYYDSSESFVLREIGVRNCRCVGCNSCDADNNGTCGGQCCVTYFSESVLGCPMPRDYGYEQYGDGKSDGIYAHNIIENLEIGSCDYTQQSFTFSESPEVAPGVIKTGIFTMSCSLKKGSKCDGPFCDAMLLSQVGSIYETVAVAKANTDYPAADDSCGGSSGGQQISAMRMRASAMKIKAKLGAAVKKHVTHAPAKRSLLADNAADADAAGGGGAARVAYAEHPHYWRSNVAIYAGPVFITSHKFNVKYSGGYLEYVRWDHDSAEAIEREDAYGAYFVNPFAYTFKFPKLPAYRE